MRKVEDFHVEKGAWAGGRNASPAALELISRFGQMEEDRVVRDKVIRSD